MSKEQFPAQHAAFLAATERAQWVPSDYFGVASIAEVFGRDAPLEVDLGCGDGTFLLALAKCHSDRNFLGVERLAGRVEKVSRRIARSGLSNVRVARIESAYTLGHLLPERSVERLFVLFPDPWPKRHHHRRRLIQLDFLEKARRALKPNGELWVKTDDEPYFRWMERVFSQASGYERVEWPLPDEMPQTDFEELFVAKGLPIYRARLRKV